MQFTLVNWKCIHKFQCRTLFWLNVAWKNTVYGVEGGEDGTNSNGPYLLKNKMPLVIPELFGEWSNTEFVINMF